LAEILQPKQMTDVFALPVLDFDFQRTIMLP
jgi:hypothetical protein